MAGVRRFRQGRQMPGAVTVAREIAASWPGRLRQWSRARTMAAGMCTLAAACGDVNAALAQLSDARGLSANLHVEFMKAAGATDRAVMADTNEASVTFAHEADDAMQATQHDIDLLAPILADLDYPDEAARLQQFRGQFATYRELNRRILDLAVQNTNLEAQRLSLGPAREAAGLSRQNTNVRSLALSLDEKRKLTAPCEDSLRAIESALAQRGYSRGREGGR